MNELVSPSEMLNKLYQYLLHGNREKSIELFAKNSAQNQLRTFLNMLRASDLDVYYLGEYIVVFTKKGSNVRHIFVVGLDDNYRFFCHNLPDESTKRITPENISVQAIRDEMGFDYHLWEVVEKGLAPRIRIRIQGDIVIQLEEIFETDNELYSYLYQRIILVLLRRTKGTRLFVLESEKGKTLKYSKGRTPEEFLRTLRSYLESLSEYDLAKVLEFLRKVSLDEYDRRSEQIDANHNIDDAIEIINEYTRKMLEMIFDLEAILNLQVGNHIVRVIGVSEWDIIRLLRSESPPPPNMIRVYVLRPHRVLVLHEEHGAASLDVPRSILRIQTLRTGSLQVTRPPRPRPRAFLQIKIVIVDLCGLDPIVIMPRSFITSWRYYLEILGVQPYIYSHEVNVDGRKILCRANLWYIRPEFIPETVYRTYFKGSVLGIFIVDVADRFAIQKLKQHVDYFWANTNPGTPIVIVGYRRRNECYERPEITDELKKFSEELSKRIGIPSTLVEANGSRRVLRDIIISHIERVSRQQLQKLKAAEEFRKKKS